MGLIKEPKDADFSMQSMPWTEQELADFRQIMQKIKAINTKKKETIFQIPKNKKQKKS